MNKESPKKDTRIIVVMGVSGCGKSTIAKTIAEQLNAHFKDGDELHPESNIKKMESGIPLTDMDREPWLNDVASYAREHSALHGICVIACSALKLRYREILNEAGNVVYVFLEGSFELIASRMNARIDHFMPDTLLKSQFNALEDPRSEDNVVTVGIEDGPPAIASNAVKVLHTHGFLEKPSAQR
jgi:gluconokinase